MSVISAVSCCLECYAVCLVGDYRRDDRFLNTVENTLKSTATVLHGLRGGKGGGAGMFHGVIIFVPFFYVSLELFWSPVERHFL